MTVAWGILSAQWYISLSEDQYLNQLFAFDKFAPDKAAALFALHKALPITEPGFTQFFYPLTLISPSPGGDIEYGNVDAQVIGGVVGADLPAIVANLSFSSPTATWTMVGKHRTAALRTHGTVDFQGDIGYFPGTHTFPLWANYGHVTLDAGVKIGLGQLWTRNDDTAVPGMAVPSITLDSDAELSISRARADAGVSDSGGTIIFNGDRSRLVIVADDTSTPTHLRPPPSGDYTSTLTNFGVSDRISVFGLVDQGNYDPLTGTLVITAHDARTGAQFNAATFHMDSPRGSNFITTHLADGTTDITLGTSRVVANTEEFVQQDLPFDPTHHYTTIFHAPLFGQLLDNDKGDHIQVTNVGPAGQGVMGFDAQGGVSYLPNQFFYGDADPTTPDDFFTYTIKDSSGTTDTTTDSISITPLKFYLDQADEFLKEAKLNEAHYKQTSEKQLQRADDQFDLATDGLKALQHEKLLFLLVDAVGRISKINPAIGLIVTAVKLAVSDPLTGEQQVQQLDKLMTTLISEYTGAGSVGHNTSGIINGLNDVAKTINKQFDNKATIDGLSAINETVVSLTDFRNQAQADADAILAKRDALGVLTSNAQSYHDAYAVIASHVAPFPQ